MAVSSLLHVQLRKTYLCVSREIRAGRAGTSDGGGGDRRRDERREPKLHLNSAPREGCKTSQNCAQAEAGVVRENVEEEVRRPRCRQRIAGL